MLILEISRDQHKAHDNDQKNKKSKECTLHSFWNSVGLVPTHNTVSINEERRMEDNGRDGTQSQNHVLSLKADLRMKIR